VPREGGRSANRGPVLLATAFDPPRTARADPVVVIAAHFGAVPVEVDADRATAATARARAPVGDTPGEVGLLDGRGRHAAPLPLEGYAVARKRLSVPELFEASWLAPP